MATLVLGAVGTLVGGPLGGALGALAGRQIDGALIGSPGREGPRLDELKVTTSSYGQPIPRHIGRMRTAGTIVWATDLREAGETTGGKGQPKTTTYSYSTSFAVVLACHPIDRVGRIWADGNLLRGAAGDLKTGGRLRVHGGHGDQEPDPLMAAALGNRCPAFRGIAYLVFEDLQLADFGNRIPALSYEVFAGSGHDAIGVLAREAGANASAGAEAALALPMIEGFTHAGGGTDRSLALLRRALPLVPRIEPDGLRLTPPPAPETATLLGEGAVWDEGEFGARHGRRGERAAPAPITFAGVRYYDVARDYLPGVQRAVARPERTGQDLIDLPVAAEAEGARLLGRAIAREEDQGRDRHFVRIAELDPALTPGTPVRVPGLSGIWTVAAWEWRERGVELELHRLSFSSAAAAPATSGVPWSPPDRLPGLTTLDAFELPWDGTGAPDLGTVHAAVGASEGRWAGAALYIESAAALTVELASEEMVLAPTGMAGLASGANRLLVGEEVLQFRDAVQIGARLWALDGMLRGRLGTEHAASAGHTVGSPVVLLDERLVALDAGSVGAAERLAAIGRADAGPVYAPIRLRGAGDAPPSPVHPRAIPQADGSLSLTWTRRARGAWRWSDGLDVPLVEASELYEVGVGPASAPLALWQTGVPSLTLTAADVASLSVSVSGATIWVRQVGTFARSTPLALAILP